MALRNSAAVQPKELRDIVGELQRLKVSVVTGAAAATKMNLAAIRAEDTVLSVLAVLDAAGSANTPADDTAQVTISDIRATGTITVSGNPVNDETFVVNGKTYTFKTTPTLVEHVKIVAGDNNAMAANIKNAINAWEGRRLTTKWRTPDVVATVATNVVTVKARLEGAAGNAFTLTEAATNVAVSGAGTLTGGSDTGGIQSSTNNTGKTLMVYWYDKN